MFISILLFVLVQSMTGEWCPPEEISANKPPPSNPILGHVIYRMMSIVYPPEPEPPPPVISPFPIKGCILGKLCSGKTTCLNLLEEGRACCSLERVVLHCLSFFVCSVENDF